MPRQRKVFCKRGAHVIVVGTSEASVETFLSQNDSDRLMGVVGTIGGQVETTSLVNQAASQLGALDVLVNSAGIFDEQPFDEMSQDHWSRMLHVNLDGAAFSCQAALPYLKKSEGNIVTLASDAGIVPYPSSIAYCVAKTGVVALTKCLALEYAGQVRVNCVCPSNVDTDMIRVAAENADDTNAYLESAHSYAPIGRMALPEEVANTILFLASAEASYVTGVAMPVDGGRSCK